MTARYVKDSKQAVLTQRRSSPTGGGPSCGRMDGVVVWRPWGGVSGGPPHRQKPAHGVL
jgi:hypothetical protein